MTKLYSWNVNGIRAVANKGTFQQFLSEYQPDVLCLQETKAQPDQIDLDALNAGDYHVFWNSATKKGYSGTAIFTKSEPLHVVPNIPEPIASKYQLADTYGNTNDEGRVLAAEFPDYWVVTVYTPNSKGDLTRLKLREEAWDSAFLEYIKQLEQTKPVLFCGDLNVAHTEIDLANPKANVGKHGFTDEERRGFQNFLDHGLIDTFRLINPGKTDAYSWWTHWANARARNVGWRIDYWLASKSLADHIKNAQIHPEVMGSDHCPVSIELGT